MTKEEIIKQLAEVTETEPKVKNGLTVFYLSGGEVTIGVAETEIFIGIDRDFCGAFTDFTKYSHDSIKSFTIDVDVDKDNWKWIRLAINTINGVRYIAI